ncbi:MAG: folate-binding protein YgfZ [Gammaproteobacteria bacterium]|nr:folate-binding protein YgfZ [Gammaproteobacteria bacterium]MDH5734944.1 folate-binding protein YgfZ [Gammaproteobacteria bacterium]
MKPEWQLFLENAGAEITDGKVISFGNIQREQRMAQTGLIMTDLSHFGLISVYGDGASDFLQGQLTNDIRNVSENHSQLSAYCTPKGRMLSNFRIFKRNETFYLRLPRTLVETTLNRIRMFILMAKVTMEDSSDSLVHFGVSGPKANEKLKDIFNQLPEQNDDTKQINGYTIVKVPGIHPRYEIYGELEDMKKLWSTLDVNTAPIGYGPWSRLDILAGIPVIYPETTEAFVPQMANMQLINGVNFQKGCYSGQEIVARMQYLGKLKRRMFLIKIATEEQIKPGTPLFSSDSTSGQGTGTIVDAQPDSEGATDALAVIDINDAEKSNIRLYDENGPEITLLDLPYSAEKS